MGNLTRLHKDSKSETEIAQNLEGRVFGQLTILGVHRNEKKILECRCRCTCGCEKEVYLSDLVSGRTKSCGCQLVSNHRNARDISGQRFGKLIAIEPTKERQCGAIVWRCQCDCGKETYVSVKNLVSRTKMSCGCEGRTRGRANLDLKGKRFGRLTAVRKTEKRSQKGSVIWECRCDCGNTVFLACDSLVNGNQKSCGCLRTDKLKEARENLHFVDGTCIEWLHDRKLRIDNSNGHTGISRRKNGRYFAKIGFQNKQYYLGTYEDIKEAIAARQIAEELLFDTFLNEYRAWKDLGGQGDFHFDVGVAKASLESIRNVDRHDREKVSKTDTMVLAGKNAG